MVRRIFVVLLGAACATAQEKPVASAGAPPMCMPCVQPCTAYPGCAEKPAPVAVAKPPTPPPAPAPAPAPVVAPPPPPAAAIAEFSPAPGKYTGTELIRITSATPGAVIHCTTDGTDPTADSPICMDPVPVEESTTVKAISVAPGFSTSAIVSGIYEIEPPPPIALREMVFFDTGKIDVRPEAYTLLDDVAALLKAHPEIPEAIIEGHADAVGGEQLNERLSIERAEAVRKLLIDRGVEPERLVPMGAGATMPIGDNETEDGRSVNRRVEILTGE